MHSYDPLWTSADSRAHIQYCRVSKKLTSLQTRNFQHLQWIYQWQTLPNRCQWKVLIETTLQMWMSWKLKISINSVGSRSRCDLNGSLLVSLSVWVAIDQNKIFDHWTFLNGQIIGIEYPIFSSGFYDFIAKTSFTGKKILAKFCKYFQRLFFLLG